LPGKHVVRRAAGGNDLVSIARRRSEYPVVAHEMKPGRRNERCEPGEQFEGLEQHMGRAVAPTVPETVDQQTVFPSRQAFGGQGRSCRIAAQALQTLPVACRDADAGVQADAIKARTVRNNRECHVLDLDSVAKSARATAGMWAH